MNDLEEFMVLKLDEDLVFASVEDVVGPRVVTDFDKICYYRHRKGWVKDLMFERRLQT